MVERRGLTAPFSLVNFRDFAMKKATPRGGFKYCAFRHKRHKAASD